MIVLDTGPTHVGKATTAALAALAARAHWLTVEGLPGYAPGLDGIERTRHGLKAHPLAHRTFTDPQALDHAIHAAVEALNGGRQNHPLARQTIPA